VIRFGQFVVGGSACCRLCDLLALIAIQYLVISHGQHAAAEVSRATLTRCRKADGVDAMNAGRS
jgi:flagellar biosynthesis component FlhA